MNLQKIILTTVIIISLMTIAQTIISLIGISPTASAPSSSLEKPLFLIIDIERNLGTMKSSYQEFMTTGKEERVADYNNASKDFSSSIDNLVKETKDSKNADTVENIEDLAKEAQTKFFEEGLKTKRAVLSQAVPLEEIFNWSLSGNQQKIISNLEKELDSLYKDLEKSEVAVAPAQDNSTLFKMAVILSTLSIFGALLFLYLKTSGLHENLDAVDREIDMLSGLSTSIVDISRKMSRSAEETSAQANSVSAAAEQVSRNLTMVASGAEEMSVSAKEIAKYTVQATDVGSHAVRLTTTTNETVNKLCESSTDIGNILKIITAIAQQTKLLALNASVEAARAGESGKGFAVVANEVKELAKETAHATANIAKKIEAIQTETRDSAAAIQQISKIINDINGIQQSIASAVEQQTSTTTEISRNLLEGSRATSEIARNTTSLASIAQDTTNGSLEIEHGAHELTRLVDNLQKVSNKIHL